jgi:uncharacterized membrane protein
VGTARLETFADGVFAIAATLLILDVRPRGHGSLAHQLLHAWPSYAGYAVSFLTIGIIWANHHTVLNQIGRVDRTFLMLNVAFLMCVAFIPFPTRLLAEHLRDSDGRAAAVSYGVTLTVTALFYAALWFYAAVGRRLLAAEADPRVVSGISRSYAPGAAMYATAAVAGAFSAVAASALFAAIALFYVFESSFFGRG